MSVFKFKQFAVDQSGCAMKINTDGVLLAALAQSGKPDHILDIGTGTGVLALMMAQRFPFAKVHAVEIDQSAAATAGKNFAASPFRDRLVINHVAIEEYLTEERFDLMISNPPFFVNDLKNTEEKKGIARHASTAFFEELLDKVNLLLTENGSFWVILPVKQAVNLIAKAELLGLKANEIIHLHSDRSKAPFRQIVCLHRNFLNPITTHFYIYESEKVYTKAYKDLLKDFFLGY